MQIRVWSINIGNNIAVDLAMSFRQSEAMRNL